MTLFDDPDAAGAHGEHDRPPPPVPARLSFKALRESVQDCRACELYEGASHSVMGTGPSPGKARGKRRIHQTPERVHVAACRPWLAAELRLVKPQALVCLGATSAQALLGSHVRIGRDRGRPMDSELAPLVTLTTHPSAILRQRDDAEREAAMDAFVVDLHTVAEWLAGTEGEQ